MLFTSLATYGCTLRRKQIYDFCCQIVFTSMMRHFKSTAYNLITIRIYSIMNTFGASISSQQKLSISRMEQNN